MKNFFEALVNWFSEPHPPAIQLRPTPTDMPEHERRLRELARDGRIVFLP
jgi:hypothetical protein